MSLQDANEQLLAEYVPSYCAATNPGVSKSFTGSNIFFVERTAKQSGASDQDGEMFTTDVYSHMHVPDQYLCEVDVIVSVAATLPGVHTRPQGL